jgi:dUTP pyrophosphatase
MSRKQKNFDQEEQIDDFLAKRKIPVKIKADAPEFIPKFKSKGAAAADLVANIPTNDAGHNFVSIMPNQVEIIDVGFAMSLPLGWEAQIRVRSGLASQGLQVTNSPGTIDCDYFGRIKVIVNSTSKNIIRITHGDRFAQILVKPVWQIDWIEVDELEINSDRGTKGFGSTGK